MNLIKFCSPAHGMTALTHHACKVSLLNSTDFMMHWRNHRPVIVVTVWLCFVEVFGALGQPLALKLQRLVETEKGSGRWQVSEKAVKWEPVGTAVVICDMWDKHWCK